MRFNEYEQEEFEKSINNFTEKFGTDSLVKLHQLHLFLTKELKLKHFPLMQIHYYLIEKKLVPHSKGKILKRLFDELKIYFPTQRSFNNFLQHYFKKFPDRINTKFKVVKRRYDFGTEKLLYTCGYKSNIPLSELIKQLKQEKLID